jgi:putative Holliday junction resolvase
VQGGFRHASSTYRILSMMVRGASERESTAAGMGSRSRVLAIDYGRRRIGLALSDELGLTARPLTVLTRMNRRADLRRLRELCREHGVARIVVGHPVNMGGGMGEMAEEAARFAVRVERDLGIETELLDERLTSWEAERTVTQGRASRRNAGRIDAIAAAILLREYLERHRPAVPAAAGRRA